VAATELDGLARAAPWQADGSAVESWVKLAPPLLET